MSEGETTPTTIDPAAPKKKTWTKKPPVADPLDNVDQDLAAIVRISGIMRGLRLGADKKVIAWFVERYVKPAENGQPTA